MRPIRFMAEVTRAKARAGILSTPHGEIRTPAFVPVGTKAGVKGVLPEQLAALGAQVVLANTYHLYLQPGEKTIHQAGGLGTFMNWGGPTMTDSGGFQVFSLGAAFGRTITKIASGEEKPREHGVAVYDEDVQSQHGQLAIVDDEGVTFTSHLDGSLHRFTPERSIEIQHALGADIFLRLMSARPRPSPMRTSSKRCVARTAGRGDRSVRIARMWLQTVPRASSVLCRGDATRTYVQKAHAK